MVSNGNSRILDIEGHSTKYAYNSYEVNHGPDPERIISTSVQLNDNFPHCASGIDFLPHETRRSEAFRDFV